MDEAVKRELENQEIVVMYWWKEYLFRGKDSFYKRYHEEKRKLNEIRSSRRRKHNIRKRKSVQC